VFGSADLVHVSPVLFDSVYWLAVTSSGFSDLVLNFRLFANLVQLFYGEREPTWIVGNYPHEEIQAPYARHMVPVSLNSCCCCMNL
jgi:hypothetical protein